MAFEKIKVANPIVEMDGEILLFIMISSFLADGLLFIYC